MDERLLREQPTISRLVAKRSTYRHGRVDVEYLVAFEGYSDSEQAWYSVRDIRNRYDSGVELIRNYEAEEGRVVAQERRERAVAFAPLTQEPYTQFADTPSQDFDLGLNQLFATPRSPARVAGPSAEEARHAARQPANNGQAKVASSPPPVPWASRDGGNNAAQRRGADRDGENFYDAEEEIYDPFPPLSSALENRLPASPAVGKPEVQGKTGPTSPAVSHRSTRSNKLPASPAVSHQSAQDKRAPTSPTVAGNARMPGSQAEERAAEGNPEPAEALASRAETPNADGSDLSQLDDHYDPFPPLAAVPGSCVPPGQAVIAPAVPGAAPSPSQVTAAPRQESVPPQRPVEALAGPSEPPAAQQQSSESTSTATPAPTQHQPSPTRSREADRPPPSAEAVSPVREQPSNAPMEGVEGPEASSEEETPEVSEHRGNEQPAAHRQTGSLARRPIPASLAPGFLYSPRPPGEASNEQPKADVRGLESLVKNLISQQASNRLRPGGNVQPPRAPSTQPPVNTAAATSQVRQPIVPPAQPIPARGVSTLQPTASGQPSGALLSAPQAANAWVSLNLRLAGMVSQARTQTQQPQPSAAQAAGTASVRAVSATPGPAAAGGTTSGATGRLDSDEVWQLYLQREKAHKEKERLAAEQAEAARELRELSRDEVPQRKRRRAEASRDQAEGSARPGSASNTRNADANSHPPSAHEDAEDPVEVMSEGDLEDAGELPDDVLNRLRPREWQHAEIKGARQLENGLDMQVQWSDGFSAWIFHTHLKSRSHCLLKMVDFYESKTRKKRLRAQRSS